MPDQATGGREGKSHYSPEPEAVLSVDCVSNAVEKLTLVGSSLERQGCEWLAENVRPLGQAIQLDETDERETQSVAIGTCAFFKCRP